MVRPMNAPAPATLPPATIALRTLCLQAIVVRAQVEQDARVRSQTARARWQPLVARVNAWVQQEGFGGARTLIEARLLDAPAFSWKTGESTDGVWRLEALGTLLWALGKVPVMPAGFDPFGIDDVDSILPPFGPTKTFVDGATLRPLTEIDRARRVAGIWAWRAKNELMRRRSEAPMENAMDVIRRGVEQAKKAGLLPDLMDGDIVIRGAAFHRAATADVLESATIAHERTHALEWALGKRAWSDAGASL